MSLVLHEAGVGKKGVKGGLGLERAHAAWCQAVTQSSALPLCPGLGAL